MALSLPLLLQEVTTVCPLLTNPLPHHGGKRGDRGTWMGCQMEEPMLLLQESLGLAPPREEFLQVCISQREGKGGGRSTGRRNAMEWSATFKMVMPPCLARRALASDLCLFGTIPLLDLPLLLQKQQNVQ
ncbi:hypothetical protein P7K49_000123 [Saguinus oedipus]|uniref:Uncharacterized protein n=1 Tax=Saguinus oedipus TaxID=9490 RepID=A0ABQ9WAU8_SAGOE|nr:hypothetical protein P7K49_000123 [Saguinus oedipus]